jgi:uncharacterized protein
MSGKNLMMNALPEIELTAPQRAALHAFFARFADRLEVVGVYGSRSQARARPGSDIDLVVYGGVTDRDISEMRISLDESDLSIFADVVAYNLVTHVKLREQIDKWANPLFTRADLLS